MRTYLVDKIHEIEEGTDIDCNLIHFIINEDSNVYNRDKKLICKFRKNKLNKENLKNFYDNVKKFAHNVTTNRGSVSGSSKKNVRDNPKIKSNVLGYIDGFSPSQKKNIKTRNLSPIVNVRECRYNIENSKKWELAYPLIKEIDLLYKKYLPIEYEKQRQKADETYYRIKDTAFTTITTNINFKTKIHKDKGDYGFGNLVVIEDGEYEGSETCFPEYGFGVNVRQGDILFMDTHEYHGNLKMYAENEDVVRLSVVSYLKLNVYEYTKKMTNEEIESHNKLLKQIGRKKNYLLNLS
jgi:hypothetical protein